jgi:hypothetical protein
MTYSRFARVALLSLLLLGCPIAPASAKDKAPSFVKSMLDRVEIGEPLKGKLVILFPLVLKDADTSTGVGSQFAASVGFSEPEFPDHRYDVAAQNGTDKPMLIVGGTVLVGGERDRLLRHDVILPAQGQALMRAFPAASTDGIRKEPIPFDMAGSFAPIYLRKEANFGGGANMVPMFVSRNLEFRNEGDTRKSLAAIGGSDLLQSWTAEVREKISAAMKDVENRGQIVGFISSMRGRIQSLELYGSRDLLQAAGPAYLLGATYSGAALAIQAGKKKIPLPGADDPVKNLEKVTKLANKLLADLRKARLKKDKTYPDGAVGERIQLQLSDRTRGRAVAVDGKLIHLGVFPYDPVESQLYGTAIHIPTEKADDGGDSGGADDGPVLSDPNRMGLAELSRWAGRGHRVTPAEQGLLNGMGRGGRGGGMRGGGMRGGGGGGGGRRR